MLISPDLPSWDVFLVCVIIFVGMCNVAFITLRYRLKLPGASKMAGDQLKWIRQSCSDTLLAFWILTNHCSILQYLLYGNVFTHECRAGQSYRRIQHDVSLSYMIPPKSPLTIISWSTTVKTVEKSNFFLQIPIILKRFYPQLGFFTVMIVSSSVLYTWESKRLTFAGSHDCHYITCLSRTVPCYLD